MRKQLGLTQQALADAIELHVNQIKLYEAGTAQPTQKTLVMLLDLVFGEDQRGPSDDLRLQFEALSQFDEEDKKIAKTLLESLILKHNAKRAFVDELRTAGS